MPHFVINGRARLKGEVRVSGSKNAATPILAATLLTTEPCIIDNMPFIEDVQRMLDILASMGSQIEWLGPSRVRITNKSIDPAKLDFKLVSRLRSSILLLGPLLARFHSVKLSHPGGCLIGARPVGVHFNALEKLGADVRQDENFYYLEAKKLEPAYIVLGEFSVTGTENALMAASMLEGTTVIKIAAAEPHIEDLARFLIKMGVRIKGVGTHTLEITGTKKLHGAKHTIIPDPIEAGTFLIGAAATQGKVLVRGAQREHLDLVTEKLEEFGAHIDFRKEGIYIESTKSLSAAKIEARPYPGVPTDLQSLFGVLATQAEGTSLIFDTLYESRLKYLDELNKMGANAAILDPHRAVVTGPTPLYGQGTVSFDLRTGAALIIAGALAQGQTLIQDAYQVDRGYERIEQKLQGLGLDIQRVE